jgi:GH18 family chitinase
MDWPHDPDGEKGSEGMRKYGHAVIAKKIDEEEDFPLSKSEFVEEYGDDPVRIDYETVVSVRDVFENVQGEEFEDFVELHKELGRAMREAGYWFYEGAETFVGDA